MESIHIITVFHLILTIVILGALIYAFYRIYAVHTTLNNELDEIKAKVTRIIQAINSVGKSNYSVDTRQDAAIDELLRAKPK